MEQEVPLNLYLLFLLRLAVIMLMVQYFAQIFFHMSCHKSNSNIHLYEESFGGGKKVFDIQFTILFVPSVHVLLVYLAQGCANIFTCGPKPLRVTSHKNVNIKHLIMIIIIMFFKSVHFFLTQCKLYFGERTKLTHFGEEGVLSCCNPQHLKLLLFNFYWFDFMIYCSRIVLNLILLIFTCFFFFFLFCC